MSRRWLALIVLVVMAAGCQPPAPIIVIPPATSAPIVTPTPAPIRVYVSGAVANPGVYVLPPHSIGDDALKAAGGPTAEADLERVNLALELHDQDHFHLPRKGEPGIPQETPAPGGGLRININTATIEELEQLPGIGPVTAQKIVDFREQNGPFQRIEDIMEVKGIGPATFEQIKDMIAVGD